MGVLKVLGVVGEGSVDRVVEVGHLRDATEGEVLLCDVVPDRRAARLLRAVPRQVDQVDVDRGQERLCRANGLPRVDGVVVQRDHQGTCPPARPDADAGGQHDHPPLEDTMMDDSALHTRPVATHVTERERMEQPFVELQPVTKAYDPAAPRPALSQVSLRITQGGPGVTPGGTPVTRLLRTPLAVTLGVLGVLLGLPGLPVPANVRAQDGRGPRRAASTTLALASTTTAECVSVSTCYSPRQVEAAYGLAPLLAHGTDGSGETVVLPELAEPQFPLPTSDIRADLGQFDQLFHLPAAHLRAVTTLAPSASPWLANGEEVLDTEMVHAVAPGAAIVELLVSGASLDSAANAVAASVAALRLGSTLGSVISLSAAGQTGGEGCDSRAHVAALHAALQLAAARHVTVVAASGDIGAVGEPCTPVKGLIGGTFRPVKQVNLPAADPLVLAAGGTTLSATPTTGAYVREAAWGLPAGDPGSQFQASGGGFSQVVRKPSYQKGVAAIGADRGVPDVATDASPHTAVVTSQAGGGYTISGHGGTSASAPLWAGMVALADQYAGRHLGVVNAAIYGIARSSAYHQAFHDITTGDNAVRFPPQTISGYQAGPGWDAVTGWGSPDARVLVPLLARYVRAEDARGR